MVHDENEFFRRATTLLCSSLDCATALHRCLLYLGKFMPIDMMILWVFDESAQGLRRIAVATPEEGLHSDMVMLLPPATREKLVKMDIPHMIIERSGFAPVVMRLVNHPDSDPMARSLKQYFEPNDYSSMVMYLEIEGKRLGTLFVRAEGKNRYTEYHTRRLALLHEPFSLSVAHTLLFEENRKARNREKDDDGYFLQKIGMPGNKIIGADCGLKGVMEMVSQVGLLNSPVLLRGETGVGKDMIANVIHHCSPFRCGPFIKVNCGAIPETLIDSELFGHEKGSFTGATIQKRGCFERANHGTIFLDEIGELPPHAQVRLLRVLQFKEVQRVGGADPVPLNIRVIAATHRKLEEMVETGLFREDLWFRLNVFPIFIPPLRHRKEDIPELVHDLVVKKSRELKLIRVPALAPGTISRLTAYHWPGNVRELENIIERALILCKGDTITTDAFLFRDERTVAAVQMETDDIPPLDEIVSAHIKKALVKANGRIHGPDGAARLLGVNSSTLRNKMDKLGIKYGRALRSKGANGYRSA